ncbi:hypothetical protein L6452_21439 [Arctium lappa]|uniref:Uncharacterized protein n=1 Tax=Arctium lappa TaxID=4217 RepID=A0ACB9AWL8_ARCLA|nr:hypothetical protein L6452_21439 [Arctium lappa]
MSTSSETVDSIPLLLPTSNFSHTFNLFTQYLKNKPLGMAMNLFHKSSHQLDAVDCGFPQQVPKKEQSEPESAQMSIFYAGKMIVLDDFPADKAMEIFMILEKAKRIPPKTEPSDLVASTHMENQGVRLPGLPIARKASLARFLEKRKERITARAPYQREKAAWLGLAGEP